MNQHDKFSAGRHQEQAGEAQAARAGVREFQTAEELLRHDAAQTAVPPEIVRRLSQSIAQSAPARRPWWRKLLG